MHSVYSTLGSRTTKQVFGSVIAAGAAIAVCGHGVWADVSDTQTADNRPVAQQPQSSAKDVRIDINQDGALDYIDVSGRSITVYVQENGNLIPSDTLPLPAAAQAVLVGDIDSDGLLDIVIAHRGTFQATTYLGTSEDTFISLDKVTSEFTPQAVFTTNLNGDRYPDVIATDVALEQPQVFLSQRDAVLVPVGVPQNPEQPSVAPVVQWDVNFDGLLDVIVSDLGVGQSTVLLNTTEQMTSTQDMSPMVIAATLPKQMRPLPVAIKDLNGDGLFDVVQPISTTETAVFIGQEDGTYLMQDILPVTAASSAQSIVIGHVNTDKVPDVIVIGSDQQITMFVGNGDGSFVPTMIE